MLRIGITPGFSSGTWLKANAKLLTKHGFKTKFINFNQTADMAPALEQGSLDFFECGVPPAVLLSPSYPGMRLLGVTLYDNFTINVAKKSTMTSLKDLEGKKVAVVAAASQQWILINAAMKKAGANPKKVHFVYTKPQAMSALLKKGQIDAMAVWAPFITEGVRSGDQKVLVTGREVYESLDEPGRWPADGIFTSQDVIDNNPKAVSAMKAAAKAFLSGGTNGSDSVASAWATQNDLPAAAASYPIKSNVLDFPRKLETEPDTLEAIWDIYATVGKAQGKAPESVKSLGSYEAA